MVGCRSDEDSWELIQASGVLRVGVDPTFPPFALAEGDVIEGIDVDLARAVAGELGLEAQFTYFGYDGLYDALTTGQVDALISALVIAPERTKEVAYTAAYYDAGQVLIVPEASAGIEDMADLYDRTLAVELGALGHVEALEWQSRLGGLTIDTYPGVVEALAAVRAGEANAALVDSVGGRLALRDQSTDEPRLVRLPKPVLSEPYAIAVRIEDEGLREALDEALARLKTTGTLEAIIERHLGP
jgi:polar amino acid transport system substrate-binding protein